MMILLAIAALAIAGWVLLPLFGSGVTPPPATAKVTDVHRRDAAASARRSLEELETDFAEGKIESADFEQAKSALGPRP